MDGHTSTRSRLLRRLGAGLLGAAIAIGAIAPAVPVLGVAIEAPNDLVTTSEDTPATGNVLANDTGMVRVSGWHASATAPGILVIGVDGAYTFTPASEWSGATQLLGWYWADPDLLDNGNDVLTYVHVEVTAVDDAPIATGQEVSTDEDTPKAITLAGTDPDSASLSYGVVAAPAHGDLTGTAPALTYTPDAGWHGQDSFTFTVSDGTTDSAPATVTIDVASVADVPVATAASVNVPFKTATAMTLAGTDGDGDSLTFVVLSEPTKGTLSGTAPNLTYTPTGTSTGADSFTFKVNDGSVDSEPATVAITILHDTTAPAVGVPSVAFGSGRVNETAPLQIGWHATDAGLGVQSYTVEVRLNGGAWTAFSTGTTETLTRSYPFGTSLQWRVKATDGVNESAWVMSPVRQLVAYQGGSPVVRTGTWTSVTSSRSSGTGYRYTTTLGNRASLTFTGIGVLYVAPRTTSAGYAKVKIDGAATRHRLRATTTELGVIVTSKMWGSSGSHTIRVVNDHSGRRTTFDAFIVLK